MNKTKYEQLDKIFESHQARLNGNAEGIRARIYEEDLSNLDFKNYNLKGAIFLGVNFSNGDLSNLDLTGADFRKCNFTNANLSNTNLQYADLRNTNLTNAKFKNADLTMAALNDAIIVNTDLDNAILKNVILYGAKIEHVRLNKIASTEGLLGYSILSIQIPQSRISHEITLSYWRELNLITTRSFQGTMDEFQKYIEVEFKDYESVILSHQRVLTFIKAEMRYDLLMDN